MQEVFERRNDLPTVSTRLIRNSSRKNASISYFFAYILSTNIDRLHESLTPQTTPRESEGRTKVDHCRKTPTQARRGMVLFLFCTVCTHVPPVCRPSRGQVCRHVESSCWPMRALEGEGSGLSACRQRCCFNVVVKVHKGTTRPPSSQLPRKTPVGKAKSAPVSPEKTD